MPKDQQLTSVKINKTLFEEFKVECIKRKFSFQKLSDRYLRCSSRDKIFFFFAGSRIFFFY